MAIIPFSKAPPSTQGAPTMPSEANLLMALADMHSKGRLTSKIMKGPPAPQTPGTS